MEVDLVYEYLKKVMRNRKVEHETKRLMEISPSDFTSPEDVLAEIYIHLKRKETEILRSEVYFREAYITTVVKNKLNDLITKCLKRKSRFVPLGTLDDLAEGSRVPTVGPVGEIALREKIQDLVEEVLRSEWSRRVLLDAVTLSGVLSAPETTISAKLEEVLAAEGEDDVMHRDLIRAVCAAHGISPSSATRLINILKVYFGLRVAA